MRQWDEMENIKEVGKRPRITTENVAATEAIPTSTSNVSFDKENVNKPYPLNFDAEENEIPDKQ